MVLTNPKLPVTPLRQNLTSVFILIKNNPNPLIIGSQYIAPSSDISEGLGEWTGGLDSIFKDSDLLVGGDFNAHSQLWGYTSEDNRGVILFETCTKLNLHIENIAGSPPSYRHNNRKGWPDLTLTRLYSPSFQISNWSVLDTHTESDHKYISFEIQINLTPLYSTRYKTKFGNHKKFQKNFKLKLPSLFQSLNSIKSKEDLDHSTKNLIETIQQTCEISYKKKNSKSTIKFVWWTPALATQRNKIRALTRRYERLTDDEKQQLRPHLSRQKALYKKALLKSKTESWQKFCTSSQERFGTLYKIAHSKVFKPSEIVFTPTPDCPTDQFQRMTALTSTLFGNEPPPLLPSIPNHTHDTPITKFEIQEALSTLNKNKAPGGDSIDVRILEQIFKASPRLLLCWTNLCFQFGHFPIPLRNGEIVYFTKPHKDPSLPTSYRPICLLPTLSKLLEKIINKRLIYFLETSNFFTPNQHGFRERKSCDSALTDLLTLIKSNRGKGLLSHLISLDIDKAFDSVHWPTLLNLILKTNCPTVLIHLIKTFLQNRIIIIKWGNKTTHHLLNKGCPQGSVLGPSLWLIMAQSILSGFNYELADVFAFADDFILVTSGKNRRVVEGKSQLALDHFVDLAEKSKLRISISKTYHTTIMIPREKLKRFPSIKLHNKPIPHKLQFTFLGVTFQHNLRWHTHINNLKLKLQSQQNSLNRVAGRLWGVSSKLLKVWYLTTSEKTLTYAAAIWADDLTKQEIMQINSCQRPFLLKITRTYRTTPTVALNALSGIPPLDLTLNYENRRSKILLLNNLPNNLPFLQNKELLILQPSTHLHPSKISFEFSEKDPAFGSDHKIFTDGSKSDNGVGAAFIVFHENNQIFSANFKLNPEASVYQAELCAINQSLIWLMQNHTLQNIKSANLFSDSKSSLLAISKFSQQNPEIQKIQLNLSSLKNIITIKLFWTKAHVGNMGNELADSMAKQATTKHEIDIILPLARTYIKNQLHKLRITEWSRAWYISPRGRVTFRYIPKISTDLLFDSPALNNLLTDHGPFPRYFNRFHIPGYLSPNCVCGAFGDADHYMFHCPLSREHHFSRPAEDDHWELWAKKMNSNKILRRRAVSLLQWLVANQDDLIGN